MSLNQKNSRFSLKSYKYSISVSIISSNCNGIVAVVPELSDMVEQLVFAYTLHHLLHGLHGVFVAPNLVIPEQVLQLRN
ncbi:Uncharacterized protein FKW44_022075, partial [Caligus rogercresseyi]